MIILGSLEWKARSGLPISVNWTCFARCYGCGATSEYRFKIGDFAPTGASWPKISGRRGRRCPHQPFFFWENQAKWSFVWYKNIDRSFFCFVTIHLFVRWTDRQTDGKTEFSSLDRVCILQRGKKESSHPPCAFQKCQSKQLLPKTASILLLNIFQLVIKLM